MAAGVIVVIGCAGGGGNGGTGTGTGTGGGVNQSTAFVTLSGQSGSLQNVYLTGQGRAAGDLVAIIHRVAVDDSAGTVQTNLLGDRKLLLNGYTQQAIGLNVPTTTSRLFDHYDLEIQALDLDTGSGLNQVSSNQGSPFVQSVFPAYFRMFPGRTTSITVRLDDSMFFQDPTSHVWTFDPNQFQTANFSVDGANPPVMNGFLSDYVMFDLSNMSSSDQPAYPDGSGTATALFINGDNFAVGQLPDGPPDQAPATPVPFFVLTPIGYVPGSGVGPRTAINPSTGQSTLFPGTYSLLQTDPRDPLNPASHLTALVGTYTNYTKTITSVGTGPNGFEIIAFPSTHDDGVDDIVLFNINAGVISHMYFGQMNMTGGPIAHLRHGRGLAAGTISAFPVNQIDDPSNIANEITGSVTSLDSSDLTQVHSGHYTLSATNLPPTFATSGRFIVYRK